MKPKTLAVLLVLGLALMAEGCYTGGNSYGSAPGDQAAPQQKAPEKKGHWDAVKQTWVED